jgi:hypothetical protein
MAGMKNPGLPPGFPDLDFRMSRANRSLGKRKYVRRNYVDRQLIADYDGFRLPKSKDFYWVATQNVSSGGIAYVSRRKPRTHYLIVRLGTGPVACFISRVAWAFCRTDLPGKPFEVGCEFVARLS